MYMYVCVYIYIGMRIPYIGMLTPCSYVCICKSCMGTIGLRFVARLPMPFKGKHWIIWFSLCLRQRHSGPSGSATLLGC